MNTEHWTHTCRLDRTPSGFTLTPVILTRSKTRLPHHKSAPILQFSLHQDMLLSLLTGISRITVVGVICAWLTVGCSCNKPCFVQYRKDGKGSRFKGCRYCIHCSKFVTITSCTSEIDRGISSSDYCSITVAVICVFIKFYHLQWWNNYATVNHYIYKFTCLHVVLQNKQLWLNYETWGLSRVSSDMLPPTVVVRGPHQEMTLSSHIRF